MNETYAFFGLDEALQVASHKATSEESLERT